MSTWVRTAAGTEALTLAATHLLPVQAWLLIHLGPEWRSCGSLPCPANLTRVSTLASWRGVRAYNLQQLADQGLIQRQYGKAHLTELGLAALPDARVRLGLPEQDKAAR
ncbi:hypothetical protein [Deinococcus rubellus]|uniref:hypothetical protein n=1 Tax=Deinococcus rubellus TaxID=1889240 RepID=UPI0031EBA317